MLKTAVSVLAIGYFVIGTGHLVYYDFFISKNECARSAGLLYWFCNLGEARYPVVSLGWPLHYIFPSTPEVSLEEYRVGHRMRVAAVHERCKMEAEKAGVEEAATSLACRCYSDAISTRLTLDEFRHQIKYDGPTKEFAGSMKKAWADCAPPGQTKAK